MSSIIMSRRRYFVSVSPGYYQKWKQGFCDVFQYIRNELYFKNGITKTQLDEWWTILYEIRSIWGNPPIGDCLLCGEDTGLFPAFCKGELIVFFYDAQTAFEVYQTLPYNTYIYHTHIFALRDFCSVALLCFEIKARVIQRFYRNFSYKFEIKARVIQRFYRNFISYKFGNTGYFKRLNHFTHLRSTLLH